MFSYRAPTAARIAIRPHDCKSGMARTCNRFLANLGQPRGLSKERARPAIGGWTAAKAVQSTQCGGNADRPACDTQPYSPAQAIGLRCGGNNVACKWINIDKRSYHDEMRTYGFDVYAGGGG